MVSNIQGEEIDLKILRVAKEFLRTGKSIDDVAKATNISPSSAQRYLNDPRIIELLGKNTYLEIQEKLRLRKKEALSKGGRNSTTNNEVIKDELGRFNGVRKR